MAQTDRHTNRCTWRIVDQIGSEGRFVEKMCDFCIKHKTIYESKSIHWPIWIRGRNSPPPHPPLNDVQIKAFFLRDFFPEQLYLFLTDLGEAMGCSTNTFFTHSFIR